MTRLLIRSGKDPFTPVVAESTLTQDVFNSNSARINERFDHCVIPLANAFRPEFTPRLDHLGELLEHVKIPVTVTGNGAQAAHGQGVESLAPIAKTVKKFVGQVLDRSAAIGVDSPLALNLTPEVRGIDELYARLERIEHHSPRGPTKRLIRWLHRVFKRS